MFFWIKFAENINKNIVQWLCSDSTTQSTLIASASTDEAQPLPSLSALKQLSHASCLNHIRHASLPATVVQDIKMCSF